MRVWWLLQIVRLKMQWMLVEVMALPTMETDTADTTTQTAQAWRAFNPVHGESTALVTLQVQDEVEMERISSDVLRGGRIQGRTSGGNTE